MLKKLNRFRMERADMRKNIKKVLAVILTTVTAFGAFITVPQISQAATPLKSAIKQGKQDVDLDKGVYHAYFEFQENGSWVYRNPYYDPDTGIEYKDFGHMLTNLNVSKPKVTDGTVTDVEIKGNGTYTVSVTDLKGCIANTGEITIMGFSTDIPYNDKIKFSNVDVSIDGVSRFTQADAHINPDAKKKPHIMEVNVVNTWQANTGYESPTLLIPTDSMSITFTVSGFNYDNPDAVAATEEAADTSSATSMSDTDSTSSKSSPIVPIVIIVVVVVVVVVIVNVKKKSNK